jgi:hypothetical protein
MPFPFPTSLTPKKNLVLTFDAFGTLFTPRAPIGQLYIAAAKKHGVDIDEGDEERVMGYFRDGE